MLAWSCVLLAACSGGGSSDSGGGGGGGAGAFSLSVLPGTMQVPVGGASQVTVRVVPDAGFATAIELVVTGVPAGVQGVLAQTSVQGGDVALALTADPGIGAGSHTLTVTGRAGEIERASTLTLEVVDTGFDFEVDSDLQALALARGENAQTGVTARALMGQVPTVTWSVANAPTGVSGSFGAAPGGGDLLTLQADASTAVGTHEVTVVGTAGGLRRETRMLVHALAQPVANGLALHAPPVVQVRQDASTAVQVEIAHELGVTGSVALQVDGIPANVGAVFDDNPSRGALALLQITAGTGAALGEYPITVTGTQGAASGTVHLLLQVVGPLPVADARIQRVELAQSFFSRDPGLVAGKDAVVRAHVVADAGNVLAPVVRVEGFQGGVSLGTLDLTGPNVLPTGEVPANLGQSFRANLPAAWVASGLVLELRIDPDAQVADREERNDCVRIAPRVGSRNAIDLVVVPILLAGRSSQAGSYRDMLLAHWPLADVAITVRAPYTVTSVADVSSDGTGWSTLLGEIRSLRTADGSSAYYYGVVPVGYGSGVAGMGYIGLPVSVGWHRTQAVILHEIGHNFGLSHAPCGGVSSSDQDYPYPNAIIGHWGYDRRTGAIVDPRSTVDLMSYCNPDWVSGYNHEKVRGRLGSLAGMEGSGGEVPMLVVRGRLGRGGVASLDGVSRMSGRPAVAPRGDLELRLTFGGGRSATFPMASDAIGCGADPDERHFLAAVPDPGELEVLEVVQGGRVLLRESTRRPGLPVGVAGMQSGLGLTLAERDGALHVSWDAEAWPVLGVVHVGAQRTALALALRGGEATLPLGGVPRGGEFEISAADGIDGFTTRVVR